MNCLHDAHVLNMGGKKRGKFNYYKHSYQYIMEWKEAHSQARHRVHRSCAFFHLLSCKFCYNFAVYHEWRGQLHLDNGVNLLTHSHMHWCHYIRAPHLLFFFFSSSSFLPKPDTVYFSASNCSSAGIRFTSNSNYFLCHLKQSRQRTAGREKKTARAKYFSPLACTALAHSFLLLLSAEARAYASACNATERIVAPALSSSPQRPMHTGLVHRAPIVGANEEKQI